MGIHMLLYVNHDRGNKIPMLIVYYQLLHNPWEESFQDLNLNSNFIWILQMQVLHRPSKAVGNIWEYFSTTLQTFFSSFQNSLQIFWNTKEEEEE